MQIKERHFPYPVMAPWSDDLIFNADCSLEPSVDQHNNRYILSYSVTIGNQTIQQLLSEKKALLVMHVECSNTLFRSPFELDVLNDRGNSKGELELSADDIFGSTEASILVISKENITNYQPDGLHLDYQGISCELVKGDIIAALATYKFTLFQDYDRLKQLSSIITFKKDEENKTGPITIDFNSDKLIAMLPSKLHDQYLELKDNKSCSSILTSMLVIPVLTEGLTEILNNWDNKGSISEKWFNILWQKLEDMKIDLKSTSPFVAAQTILDLPYGRSSEELKHLSGVE